MKNCLNKIKLYIFSHKVISVIVLIIILALGYWGYNKFTSTTGDIRYITAKVEKSTIIASVSGSGQVSALNQIDIKPKVSGDVVYLSKKNGDAVNQGTLIAQLDTKDTQKSIRDAELNLESAKIALEKLKIEKSNENISADLAKAYDDGFNTVSDTFLDLTSIITELEDMLGENVLSDNAARMSGKTAQSYRKLAETMYYSAKDAFETNRKFYRTLNQDSAKGDIEKVINQTYKTTKIFSDAIKNTISFVDYLAEDSEDSSPFTSFQATLSTYTNTINTHLTNLLTAETNINDNKDSSLNADLDIQSSELTVKQKENTLQDAKDKLADYFIRAPFGGIISAIDIKKGDTVSTSTAVATLITNQQIAEISLNEVDVAKIKIGQKANLTFDAIPDLSISGVVAEIDSVGTVSQGVVTYIVKISFDTQDERVKSAMSVSSAIITDIRQDVLVIPNGAIKSMPARQVGQSGINYVENFDTPLSPSTNGLMGFVSKIAPNKIPVEVGISNDLQSEIISGIKEGDEIVTRTILPTTTTTAAPSIFGSTTGNRAR